MTKEESIQTLKDFWTSLGGEDYDHNWLKLIGCLKTRIKLNNQLGTTSQHILEIIARVLYTLYGFAMLPVVIMLIAGLSDIESMVTTIGTTICFGAINSLFLLIPANVLHKLGKTPSGNRKQQILDERYAIDTEIQTLCDKLHTSYINSTHALPESCTASYFIYKFKTDIETNRAIDLTDAIKYYEVNDRIARKINDYLRRPNMTITLAIANTLNIMPLVNNMQCW